MYVEPDYSALEPVSLPPLWADKLSRQQTTLMQCLLYAHPRCLDAVQLELQLPRFDRATEYEGNHISVVIWNIRKKLGKSTIQTIKHYGYRCSDEFATLHKPNVSS